MDPAVALGLLIELVDVLAWPTALIIVVFALRSQIGSAIGRMTRVRSPVGDVEFDPARQQEEIEDETERAGEAIERVPDAVLDRISEMAAAAKDAETAAGELQRANQLLQVQLAYERIYRWIYRSQMNLLVHLEARSGPVDLEEIDSFYQSHRREAGDLALSRPIWLAYLQRHELVGMTPDGTRIELTDIGRWFLIYCRALRYNPASRIW